MSSAQCLDCTATYPPDLSACPNCGQVERAPEPAPAAGSTFPSVEVVCRNQQCPASERGPVRVMLRTAAPGWVEDADLRCAWCGQVGYITRPWKTQQEEESMPKNTRDTGPSYDGALPPDQPVLADGTPVVVGEPGPEVDLPEVDADQRTEGGEQSSPGNSSATSSAKQPKKSEPSSSDSPSPASSAESPSDPDQTDGSTAGGTGSGRTGRSSASKAKGSSKSDK